MKKMERSFTVGYQWWRSDEDSEIPEDLAVHLVDSAMRHITNGLADLLTGGVMDVQFSTIGGEDMSFEGMWGVTYEGGKNLPEAPNA